MSGYVYAKSDAAETRYISLYTNLTRRPAVSPNSGRRNDSLTSHAGDGVGAGGNEDGESAGGKGETSSDETVSGEGAPSGPVSRGSSDASDASATN
ncbi:MAG: hypothetical protein KC609_06945 [Myxococcales bacterium]|nr:hypothetical protein [Myxococcales bacterium]